MTDKTKKIVVREVIILLCSAIVSVISFIGGWMTLSNTNAAAVNEAMGYIFFALIWNYPIYLLIRLAMWTGRKLKKQ